VTITFALKSQDAKRGFFDRERIMKSVDAATRKNLSKWGAFVRKDARGSLRRRKKISRPGQPPSVHYKGSGGADDGLKAIFFSYDEAQKSVVAGPVRFNRKSTPTVPELMEHGGTSKTGRYPKRPFMAPAAERTNQSLEKLWKNSIRA
jgi:hypothetical protein